MSQAWAIKLPLVIVAPKCKFELQPRRANMAFAAIASAGTPHSTAHARTRCHRLAHALTATPRGRNPFGCTRKPWHYVSKRHCQHDQPGQR